MYRPFITVAPALLASLILRFVSGLVRMDAIIHASISALNGHICSVREV